MANNTAYGFTGLQDLFNQRVAEVGVGRVFDAVRESTEEYTRVANGIESEFVVRT